MQRNQFFLAAFLAIISTSTIAQENSKKTRFGNLSVNDDNTLLFNGKPLTPDVTGNSSLSFEGTYTINDKDVVLVQDNGRSGCPAQFYFISINNSDLKATPAFGSCSDLIKIKQVGARIVITMPGFMGSFEPSASRHKAAKKVFTYVYENDVLKENGKILK